MSSLDQAIAQLQAEVDKLGQGTPRQPSDGSPLWFVLRAKSAGLSMLKQMKLSGCEEDCRSAEMFYKGCVGIWKDPASINPG